MANTWENEKGMGALLGIEGSEEMFRQMVKVFSEMELTLKDGKITSTIDKSLPLIGISMELYFKDPCDNELIYRYKYEGSFPGEGNDNKRI